MLSQSEDLSIKSEEVAREPADHSPTQRKRIVDKHDYRFAEQAGHLLRKAYQRHVALFQSHSCDAQLTNVQFSVLCALDRFGPQSQKQLVQATSVDQATIRGISERLLARGLIAMARDIHDGRKVIISLTIEGEALLDEMLPLAKQATEATLAQLNGAERIALVHILTRLAEG